MIRYLSLAALFYLLFAPAAHAADAYAIAKVNLRAGPDGGYPVVDILRRNERVELLGCLHGLQWCEVETKRGEHGWVYSYYLGTTYNGSTYTIIQTNGAGITIITFRARNYWDTYYREKYFYGDRNHWLPPYGEDGHNHHHENNNNNDDDDDDGGHGHHGGDETPTPPAPKPVAEPKYKPMPMPSRKTYNPLCEMGETEC